MPLTKKVVHDHRGLLVDYLPSTGVTWITCSCGSRTYLLPEYAEHISLETRKALVAEAVNREVG